MPRNPFFPKPYHAPSEAHCEDLASEGADIAHEVFPAVLTAAMQADELGALAEATEALCVAIAAVADIDEPGSLGRPTDADLVRDGAVRELARLLAMSLVRGARTGQVVPLVETRDGSMVPMKLAA
jgi:hypothetical protein